MSEFKDGGPAFPCDFLTPAPAGLSAEPGFVKATTAGITVRDYFAAKAMQGFFASDVWVRGLDESCSKAGTPFADGMAQQAYKYADAMLKARS